MTKTKKSSPPAFPDLGKKKKGNDLVGYGSYGCVYRPSLTCADKNVDYTDTVSKLTTDEAAQKELQEFDKVAQVDKEKRFFLGKPTLCVPAFDEQSEIDAADKCKILEDKEASDYRLLILKDGGMDLDTFVRQLPKYSSPQEVALFWVEVQNLLKGLLFFQRNGLVHNDIKPSNVVYRPDKNQLRFIDFGIMQEKDTMVRESQNNNNWLSMFHWSLPFSQGFLNRGKYQTFVVGKGATSDDNFRNAVLLGTRSVPGLAPGTYDPFFQYISSSGKIEKDVVRFQVHEFLKWMNGFRSVDYNKFLDQAIPFIDVHGLGFTLLFALNWYGPYLTDEFYQGAYQIFFSMISYGFFNKSSLQKVLDDYEKLLESTSILAVANKHFENHVVMDGPPPQDDTTVEDLDSYRMSVASSSPSSPMQFEMTFGGGTRMKRMKGRRHGRKTKKQKRKL